MYGAGIIVDNAVLSQPLVIFAVHCSPSSSPLCSQQTPWWRTSWPWLFKVWAWGGSDLQAGGRGWTLLLLPEAGGLVTPVAVIAARWGEAVTELRLGRRSRQCHLLWLGQVGFGCLLVVETSEWSVTGSSSGMAGSGGKWPLIVWPLVRLQGEGTATWNNGTF